MRSALGPPRRLDERWGPREPAAQREQCALPPAGAARAGGDPPALAQAMVEGRQRLETVCLVRYYKIYKPYM